MQHLVCTPKFIRIWILRNFGKGMEVKLRDSKIKPWKSDRRALEMNSEMDGTGSSRSLVHTWDCNTSIYHYMLWSSDPRTTDRNTTEQNLNISDQFGQATSMLKTDVGDELCWRQHWDVGDVFVTNILYLKTLASGANVQKMSVNHTHLSPKSM